MDYLNVRSGDRGAFQHIISFIKLIFQNFVLLISWFGRLKSGVFVADFLDFFLFMWCALGCFQFHGRWDGGIAAVLFLELFGQRAMFWLLGFIKTSVFEGREGIVVDEVYMVLARTVPGLLDELYVT